MAQAGEDVTLLNCGFFAPPQRGKKTLRPTLLRRHGFSRFHNEASLALMRLRSSMGLLIMLKLSWVPPLPITVTVP